MDKVDELLAELEELRVATVNELERHKIGGLRCGVSAPDGPVIDTTDEHIAALKRRLARYDGDMEMLRQCFGDRA
jgi:hypothetical protein